jgi:hypothetical protein
MHYIEDKYHHIPVFNNFQKCIWIKRENLDDSHNEKEHKILVLKNTIEQMSYFGNKHIILFMMNKSIISLKNVSHIIREVWWAGDKVMGKIEILPTVSGNILKALIDNNVMVGVSSRGMGSLKEMNEGTLEVQDDFELLCWDFVSTPSNPGSYMNLVRESKEYSEIDYSKVNSLLTEILCANGTCPIF